VILLDSHNSFVPSRPGAHAIRPFEMRGTLCVTIVGD
jgi:hypothetical protein